ncbi:DUF4920 domain-containing protein [Flagellimonas lutaonensis]|uniref:Branched-chain amino acid aminotransferase n=1 Tax=Flagellimonas lutaonensis TaxID=516051 RepID=A0A0D5YQQ1_9FLAO|nr:DUF4920 domain-containing protein [Allomuricauda lutaonensis]AKA34171.1 Branched-chain amino acid aminotransferase [Allomuricauda lutaonensis]
MKLFNILIVVFVGFFMAFGLNAQETVSFFGKTFEKSNKMALNSSIYKSLAANDTLTTQLTGQITEVCQAKGCWMKVDLEDGSQVFVKFKDYGFFVPTDVAGKTVVVSGKAFVEEMSVDEQKHYAADAGATKEKLAKITTPKRTYRFEAEGVLIED